MTGLSAFTPFHDIPALPGWTGDRIARPALILDVGALGRSGRVETLWPVTARGRHY